MNRRILFALTAFSLFAGVGAAHAEDGPVYDAAKCRRWRTTCCYRPAPLYVTRPHISSATAISQTVISNSFNNNYGRPSYGAYGSVAVASTGSVAKAAAFFAGTVPNPHYPTPVGRSRCIPNKYTGRNQ
jgi:hypothetical protein